MKYIEIIRLSVDLEYQNTLYKAKRPFVDYCETLLKKPLPRLKS